MDGVVRGIADHLRRQRPARPIRLLQFFVERDAEIPLQERGQPDRLQPDQLRRDHRVEHIVELHAVVALQRANVVIGAVQHLFLCGVGEERQQRVEGGQGERVQKHRLPGDRDLNQTDLFLIVMETVRFRIDGDPLLPGQRGGQLG